jgi:branched-chain amino acid transport system permease protein
MTAILLFFDTLFAGAQIGLVALSFALIYRTTRHIHFAFAAIWTFTAYVFGSRIDAGNGALLAFLAALSVATSLSLVCLAFYRRIEGEFALVLASFGLYLAILGAQSSLWGPSQMGVVGDALLGRTWLADVGGGRGAIPIVYIGHLLATLAAALALAWALGRTRTGRYALSVSENRSLALVTGIRVNVVEVAAYVVSALLLTVSVSVQVCAVGSDVYTGTELFIEALIVAIIAGPVIVRVVVAALLFGFVRSAAQMWLGTEWVMLATHLILLMLILLRPHGLFSRDTVLRRETRWSSAGKPAPCVGEARLRREGS